MFQHKEFPQLEGFRQYQRRSVSVPPPTQGVGNESNLAAYFRSILTVLKLIWAICNDFGIDLTDSEQFWKIPLPENAADLIVSDALLPVANKIQYYR